MIGRRQAINRESSSGQQAPLELNTTKVSHCSNPPIQRAQTDIVLLKHSSGKIERGRMHGKGVLKMKDGSCFEGEFQDDVPFKGIWTQGPSSQLSLDDVRRELFHRRFVRPASPPPPASSP